MILSNEIRTNLQALVQTLTVEDSTKQKWVEGLNNDDVPKDVLFDIIIAIRQTDQQEKIDAVLSEIKLDPEFAEYFEDASDEMLGGNAQIEADIARAKQDAQALTDDIEAIKKEYNIQE